MQRTTILLPEELKTKASNYANSMGISLGELIREALSDKIVANDPAYKRDTLLDDNHVFTEKTPSDLAQKHDDYLYGGKK